MTLNRAGDVVLQLKSPYHDGTTHIVMQPLEFMQRLAALVPRPRLQLIRFHSGLAPHAKRRTAIIPNASSDANANAAAPDPSEPLPPFHLGRLRWAMRLKRVFDSDIEKCSHCGGSLRIITALLDPTVIAPIPTHLGLSARAPPRRPARSDGLPVTV